MNRLDDIKARVVAATEGPWRVQLDGFDYGPWDEVYVANARGQYPCTPCGVPNAEFIAHARTDVPALVAAVEAVLALHKPQPYRHHTTVTETEIPETGQLRPIERCYWSDGWKCFECGPIVGPNTACPTVEAIRTALGDDT